MAQERQAGGIDPRAAAIYSPTRDTGWNKRIYNGARVERRDDDAWLPEMKLAPSDSQDGVGCAQQPGQYRSSSRRKHQVSSKDGKADAVCKPFIYGKDMISPHKAEKD